MFSTEIRVNGSLLAHIYGRNTCACRGLRVEEHKCTYDYEYYEVESRTLQTGEVKHDRKEPIRKLITLILKDVEKKRA